MGAAADGVVVCNLAALGLGRLAAAAQEAGVTQHASEPRQTPSTARAGKPNTREIMTHRRHVKPQMPSSSACSSRSRCPARSENFRANSQQGRGSWNPLRMRSKRTISH